LALVAWPYSTAFAFLRASVFLCIDLADAAGLAACCLLLASGLLPSASALALAFSFSLQLLEEPSKKQTSALFACFVTWCIGISIGHTATGFLSAASRPWHLARRPALGPWHWQLPAGRAPSLARDWLFSADCCWLRAGWSHPGRPNDQLPVSVPRLAPQAGTFLLALDLGSWSKQPAKQLASIQARRFACLTQVCAYWLPPAL